MSLSTLNRLKKTLSHRRKEKKNSQKSLNNSILDIIEHVCESDSSSTSDSTLIDNSTLKTHVNNNDNIVTKNNLNTILIPPTIIISPPSPNVELFSLKEKENSMAVTQTTRKINTANEANMNSISIETSKKLQHIVESIIFEEDDTIEGGVSLIKMSSNITSESSMDINSCSCIKTDKHKSNGDFDKFEPAADCTCMHAMNKLDSNETLYMDDMNEFNLTSMATSASSNKAAIATNNATNPKNSTNNTNSLEKLNEKKKMNGFTIIHYLLILILFSTLLEFTHPYFGLPHSVILTPTLMITYTYRFMLSTIMHPFVSHFMNESSNTKTSFESVSGNVLEISPQGRTYSSSLFYLNSNQLNSFSIGIIDENEFGGWWFATAMSNYLLKHHIHHYILTSDLAMNQVQISSLNSFEQDTMDVIISHYALCTSMNITYTLNRIKHILKPNGKLIFREPSKSYKSWNSLKNGSEKYDNNIMNWIKYSVMNYIIALWTGCDVNIDISSELNRLGFENVIVKNNDDDGIWTRNVIEGEASSSKAKLWGFF